MEETYKKYYLDFSAVLKSRSDIAGLWNSVFSGEGGDFFRLKPYEPGDKVKRLHRPSFARGEYYVKEFHGEYYEEIWLVIDLASSQLPSEDSNR